MMATRSADWLNNYQPPEVRTCRRCGAEFETSSRTAFRCPPCREIVRQEEAAKSNARRKRKPKE